MSSATPQAASETQNRRLLAWYLGARLAVVVFFLGGAIFYLRGRYGISQHLIPWISVLILISALQSVVSLFWLRAVKRWLLAVQAQLVWDLLFATAVIYMTGGVESIYSFLFVLIIFAGSLFLPRGQLLIVASAAAILHGGLLDLLYFRYLPLFGSQPFPANIHAPDVLYAIITHASAFFLTALLSGYLAERLRRSEVAREQREIDYGELERLNQAILANITSGLMVVSPTGTIRSFNQAASRITGYDLFEVYNQSVDKIIPEVSTELPGVQRGEVKSTRRDGRVVTIGYSSSPIQDDSGLQLGSLVAFQDLTDVKVLEEQLQRADRLAAVGRLASGLAHEIRNPLASISGSVQLLREDAGFSEENRRLMGIVLKEVDRLNLLLCDFLNFARPAPLQPGNFDLAALLDELVDLLRCDPQSGTVRIEQDYQRPMPLFADRQKLRQVLWDLLLNAVQAAAAAGVVRIGCHPLRGEIYLEDSGPGVDESVRERIFEPFFTTKERGTGLGLANAFANVEAHQGRLYVEAGGIGGARFIIHLPENCWTTG